MQSVYLFIMNRIVFVVTLCVAFASAQLPLKNGTCPDFYQCRDQNLRLDVSLVTGIWYVHANVPFFFQEAMKCTYFNFTEDPANQRGLNVEITEYKIS